MIFLTHYPPEMLMIIFDTLSSRESLSPDAEVVPMFTFQLESLWLTQQT